MTINDLLQSQSSVAERSLLTLSRKEPLLSSFLLLLEEVGAGQQKPLGFLSPVLLASRFPSVEKVQSPGVLSNG